MTDSKGLSIFENQGLSAEQAQFCTLIASGRTMEDARRLVGVTEYKTAKWQAELPAFEQALRRARAMIVEARVDRMADVARNEPDVNRARLIIDTDKWLASKLIASVYGDKLEVSVDHRVSVADALTAARARATLRPRCDPADIVDAEIVALPSVEPPSAVDKGSTRQLPDIFD